MKKILLLSILILIVSTFSFAQPLTGIKSIKKTGGNYSSFSAAIADLNSNGVGTGGVIFEVDSNFVDTACNMIIYTTSSSSSNPIIFKKKGTGNNPKIVAGTGIGATDAIIIIGGTDYITFDKINLSENSLNTTTTTRMECGFAIVKGSATNGAKFVTIKNCVIALNKNNTSLGIYMGNHTYTSTTQLTITDTNGLSSYCKFYNDTISNCYNAIYINGYDAPSPYTFYDQNNRIGADGGNYITNIAGGTGIMYGIYAFGQNNLKIANNYINAGTGTTASVYGIYATNSYNANVDIYNNNITLTTSATAGDMFGIRNDIGTTGSSNTVNIYNNTLQNCTYPSAVSSYFYGIYNTAAATNVNIYGNIVTGNSLAGTGYFYGINSGSCTNLNMYNNRVYSNSKSGTSGNMYCAYASTAIVNFYNNKIYSNTLPSGSTGTLYGYYNFGVPSYEALYGNRINSLSSSGAGSCTVYGIYTNSTSSATKIINNDTIYSLGTGSSGTIYYIYQALGTDVRIYKNKIYDLNSSGSASQVFGIYISSGTNVYVYNNFISELKPAMATSNSNPVYGMYFSGGTNIYAYYNTVHIKFSVMTPGYNSVAVYASTTPNVELRNNILVNLSNLPGKNIAYQRSSSTLTTYSNSSNNNCFYSGTPSSSNLIYYDGTNSDQTITTYKARVSPRDNYSVTENPPFINVTTSPFNLHLNTTTATRCESGGAPVTSPFTITDDIDNDTRNSNWPDIGADEGNFTILDNNPPLIIYTPLANTPLTTARTLTTAILDPSGVPRNGSGMPRLFWKRNYTGTYTAVTSTSIGNNQFNFSFGTPVVSGDTVYYYVVAQDSASTPNVGCNPPTGASGFSANPPAASTPPATPSFYKVVVPFPGGNYYIGGTGSTPGPGCTYVDLTDAFNDIAGKAITGAVTLILTSYYSSSEEASFPVIINPVGGASSINLVTIKPNTGVNASISGTSATSIIKLNGADYIVIDGSNNSTTSRNLVIQNNSTGSSTCAIWLASQSTGNGCIYNTIKNCFIKAGDKTMTNFGIFVGGTAISSLGSGDDNDNLTLQNNVFQKANYGLYAVASSTGVNNNMNINNNIFGDTSSVNTLGKYGIYIQYARNASISQNTISNIIGTITNPTGIYIGSSADSLTITKNSIYSLRYTGAGGYGGKAIDVYSAGTNVNMSITNNAIYDITGDGYSSMTGDAIIGIRITGTSGIKMYYNSVNLFGNISGTYTSSKSATLYIGTGVSGLDIRNNSFTNSILNTVTPAKSYAIYTDASGAFNTISYNDYYVSGTQGMLGFMTKDTNSIAGWRSLTSMDANSVSANPIYNSPTNLNPYFSSPLLAAGTYIPTFLTDILGVTRSTSAPTIGAYETGGDFSGPVITFTPLPNTSSLLARTLATTITDAGTGVPTSGSTVLPRLYWKNKYNGTYNTSIATYGGGSSYSFSLGSGVSANDTIYYYIVAQDNSTTPNVSCNPTAGAAGLTYTPPAASTRPSSPYFYKIIGPFAAGNYYVGGKGTTPGPGCTYVDLTAAFNDINNKEIQGPVALILTSYYHSSEEDTFPVVINLIAGTSSTNTVTIKPATGTTDTITAPSTKSILKLNGAKYIIVDGSNNGTNSRNLFISNTNGSSTSVAAIWLASNGVGAGSSYNTIKNCMISMGSNTLNSTIGIYLGGTTVSNAGSGDDNDNNTIQNNVITKAYYGIYAVGTPSGLLDNLIISGNTFGSLASVNQLGYTGLYLYYANGLTFTQNEILGITGTSSINIDAILIGSRVVNSTFSRNKIHDLKQTTTYRVSGINIGSGTSANLSFYNNLFYNIINNGTAGNTWGSYGLYFSNGSGYNVYFNTIDLTGNRDSVGTSKPTSISSAIFIGASVSDLYIRNNTFSNSQAAATNSPKSYAIYSANLSNPFTKINYNNYFASGAQGKLGYLTKDTSSLAGWRILTSQDTNSVSANPLFVSPTDFHPASPYLNNTALYIGTITTDYAGNTRSTTPDIGAYEFSLKPSAITGTKSSVTSNSATVNGTANANNEGTVHIYFDYGTSVTYGARVNGSPATATGLNNLGSSAGLTGLNFSTLYHYHIVVMNTIDTAFGADSIFTTTAMPPFAHSDSARSITSGGATLYGTVNAKNSSATVNFHYGLTTAYGSTMAGTPSPVTGSANTKVSASISGLDPNTPYHFRVTATNTGGTTNGNDTIFKTLAIPPTVTTTVAALVTSTTATMTAKVNANNATSIVVFDWGTTAGYGKTDTAAQSPLNGIVLTGVTFNLAGLIPNTTYHYRIRATNIAGTSTGYDTSFTTSAVPPVVTTDSSNTVTFNSANVFGTADARNSATTVTFDYGPIIPYGSSIAAVPGTVNGSTPTFVSAALTGLNPNTLYHFRVKGVNGAGTTNGNDLTFKTKAILPVATTNAATIVKSTSATLNGTVNANNDNTTVTFQYGLSITYGTTVAATPNLVTGMSNTAVSYNLSGLSPNTLYHYRVVATNSAGTVNGKDTTFKTLTVSPLVITDAASSVTDNSATLNGTANAKNTQTSVFFQYGKTISYGNVVFANQNPINGNINIPIDYQLTGLDPNTTYHYRAVATHPGDTIYGKDTTFKTLAIAPIVITDAATGIVTTAATINGRVNANNSATTVTFEYGTTTAYGTTATAIQSPVNGLALTAVTYNLSGLNHSTPYHYRVKGVNTAGTVYGLDTSFKTADTLATLVTTSITFITKNSAVSGGNITDNGGLPITARGVCWNTSPSPDISLSTKTSDGTGSGTFASNLTGLTPNTTYYVRAYATNSIGTAYGNELTFKTLTSGIDENSVKNSVSIYSYGKVACVKFIPNEKIIGTIYIIDQLGKEILVKNITGNMNLIDLTTFANGCYQVKVVANGVIYSGKVFIE